jgi:hypothetical protein
LRQSQRRPLQMNSPRKKWQKLVQKVAKTSKSSNNSLRNHADDG